MAGNTFTRRRAILLLALTSVMLITLDLRGSGAVNGMRSVFGTLFRPVERVARVVVRPVEENAWHGITDYGNVVDENRRLKDLVAYGEGAGIAAIASVREAQELLALNGLPTLAGINSCTAQVVGQSPSNFAQTVEINRGRECGIRVGMPVLNAAGLVGKITDVYDGRSVVMLITDPGYSLAVKVVNVPPTTVPRPTVPGDSLPETTTSTSTTTTTIKVTTTTGIPGFVPGSTIPPSTAVPTQSTSPNVTVQIPSGTSQINKPGTANQSEITVPAGADLPLRETGALEGRGISRQPVIRFIENQPRFGDVQIGSPVISAGGATSLAPPDIVVGTVSRVIKRSGTLGPLLEVRITANLDALNFVRVLLYQPLTERPEETVIDRIIALGENGWARLFLVSLVVLGFQTTIFNDMRPFGVCLQVMLLLAASAGLARGSETGAIAGFMVGLMYDLVLTTPLGVGAAVLSAVGYLAGYVHSFVHEPTWWTRMLLAAGASAVGMVLMPFALTVVGAEGVLTPRVFGVAFVVAVFNAGFSLPFERVCRWALPENTVRV